MPHWNAKPSTGTTETAKPPASLPAQTWNVETMAAAEVAVLVMKVPLAPTEFVSPTVLLNVTDWNVAMTDAEAYAEFVMKRVNVMMVFAHR